LRKQWRPNGPECQPDADREQLHSRHFFGIHGLMRLKTISCQIRQSDLTNGGDASDGGANGGGANGDANGDANGGGDASGPLQV
jgi:hypothetical protein